MHLHWIGLSHVLRCLRWVREIVISVCRCTSHSHHVLNIKSNFHPCSCWKGFFLFLVICWGTNAKFWILKSIAKLYAISKHWCSPLIYVNNNGEYSSVSSAVQFWCLGTFWPKMNKNCKKPPFQWFNITARRAHEDPMSSFLEKLRTDEWANGHTSLLCRSPPVAISTDKTRHLSTFLDISRRFLTRRMSKSPMGTSPKRLLPA